MEVMYQSHPEVTIATNTFINVPIILRFEGVPLIEVVQIQSAGYGVQFPVYHSDGTKIAIVKGSQIYLTNEGKKAKINLRCEPDLTACELEGHTFIELRRKGAAALKGWAELYAPAGVLVSAVDEGVFAKDGQEQLRIGGITMRGNTFRGMSVGIDIKRNSVAIGVR